MNTIEIIIKGALTGLIVVTAAHGGMTASAETRGPVFSLGSWEMSSTNEVQRARQLGRPSRESVMIDVSRNGVSVDAIMGGQNGTVRGKNVLAMQADLGQLNSPNSRTPAVPSISGVDPADVEYDRMEKISRHRAHFILTGIISKDTDAVWDSLAPGAVFHIGEHLARVARSNEVDVSGEFHTISRRDEFARLFDLLFNEAFQSRLAANPAVSCCIWHEGERDHSQSLYYWGDRDAGGDVMTIVFDTGSPVAGARGGFETTGGVQIRSVHNARVPTPAFDCMKALRLSERKICSSYVLSHLDQVLNRKYQDLRDQLSGDEIRDLQTSQRSFLRERDRCADRERCIESLYQERNDYLQHWIPRSRGDDAAALGERLVNAMGWDPRSVTAGAETEFQAVVNALQARGYLAGEPAGRWDYVDYWIFQRDFYVKGHRVVMLGHEYPGEWVGCCPSEGFIVVLHRDGTLTEIADFAEALGCRVFEDDFDLPPGWTASHETNATLGCTERDKRGSAQTQARGAFQ